MLQLLVQASIEKNEKTEACRFEHRTLSKPCIALLSGWIVEPVSGISEGSAKNREVRITRIIVAVEAKERSLGCGQPRREDAQTTNDTKAHQGIISRCDEDGKATG